MIVVDASAVLELLLQSPDAAQVEARLFDSPNALHAPHLLDLEVAQVLRRYERAGQLTAERGGQALADYDGMLIRRYPHTLLLERIWELRANLTAYDGAYVALAERLGAPLVTRDRRLAATPGHRAVIELV